MMPKTAQIARKILAENLKYHRKRLKLSQEKLGACPRIDNLLQKSWICAIFRFFSANSDAILLKKPKNSPKSNFPSLQFLFSDKLLAEFADLHRNYVGAVERGEINISVDNMEKLAQALKIDIADFFILLVNGN